MLDEVSPDNPVFLHDWTNHLAWVNSAALKAAKITKSTPDPEDGVIDRDSAGNPTGTLHNKALGLVTAVMPPPRSRRWKSALYGSSASSIVMASPASQPPNSTPCASMPIAPWNQRTS